MIAFDGGHQRYGSPSLGAYTVATPNFTKYARMVEDAEGNMVQRNPLGMMHYRVGKNGVLPPVSIGETYTSVHDLLEMLGK